jgi:hypothetical protein
MEQFPGREPRLAWAGERTPKFRKLDFGTPTVRQQELAYLHLKARL